MSGRLLVLDGGNTNVVGGIFEGRRLVTSWRLATVQGQTEDEFGLLLRGLLERDGLDPASVSAAVLASVVPPLTGTWAGAVARVFGVEPLLVRPGIKTGMRLRTDHPEEVGADRIVNALAAYDRLSDAAIVVDFGTATTFDCVSAAGDYLGGVITPGPRVSAEALYRSAARIPRVEIARPAQVVGRTTVSAVQSGLFHGYLGLVDGVLERLVQELDDRPQVLATGGLAELFADDSRFIDEVVPDLTLQGLRLLHERNR